MTVPLLPAEIVEPPRTADACVIWLHGLGADGHDFVPAVPHLGLPADHGIRFVFPHARPIPVTINGGMVMPAWYDIHDLDTLEGRGDEPGLRASSDATEALIEQQRKQGIPADRIVLAGFSQGGAVALHLGPRYTETLAGILAMSTYLVTGGSLPEEASPANAKTPILQCHGLFDPMVLPAWGEAARDTLTALGYDVTWQAWPMQHEVCLEELQRIGAWLFQRLPTVETPA
jgi:phospholipase/carboxylesterase